MGLVRVLASGGTPELLTRPDASKDETSHRWPQFLPGGKKLLFTIWNQRGFPRQDLQCWICSGSIRTIVESASYRRLENGFSACIVSQNWPYEVQAPVTEADSSLIGAVSVYRSSSVVV